MSRSGIRGAVLVLALAAMSFPVLGKPGPPKPTQIQLDDIREAVFRWQLRYDSKMRHREKVYFLSVGHRDPSRDLLKRFSTYSVPVRKLSDAVIKFDVTEKKTGNKGIILEADTTRWLGDSKAEVDGGYYRQGRSAVFGTYFLERASGKWAVKKYKVRAIS